jgi:hypothetical protein
MRLLRVVELINGETKEPVNYVCYHPIAEKRLRQREYADPECCAVDYEYESLLDGICQALGWNGGTLSQVIDEIKKLKAKEKQP